MASYRIKAVSRMTGIRPELVRMWERRYGLFKPQRAGNRYREFDDEDVQLLLYLRLENLRRRDATLYCAVSLRHLHPHPSPTRPSPLLLMNFSAMCSSSTKTVWKPD